MGRILLFLALVLGLAPVGLASRHTQDATKSAFDEAVGSYRVGDLESAEAQFEGLLETHLRPSDRGIVLFDLGNLAFRQGRFLEAVARYTAATDDLPRHADLWHNLELARSRAGLEPADGGDLHATMRRLFALPTDRELQLAGWVLLLLLGLFLAGEVRFGVLALQAGAALVLVLFVGDLVMLELRAAAHVEQPGIIVHEGGAELHGEPNQALTSGVFLEPASRVEVLDRLGAPKSAGAWVKVAAPAGTGWLPEAQAFSW